MFFWIIPPKKTSCSLEFELVFKGHWKFGLAVRVGGITGKNKNKNKKSLWYIFISLLGSPTPPINLKNNILLFKKYIKYTFYLREESMHMVNFNAVQVVFMKASVQNICSTKFHLFFVINNYWFLKCHSI